MTHWLSCTLVGTSSSGRVATVSAMFLWNSMIDGGSLLSLTTRPGSRLGLTGGSWRTWGGWRGGNEVLSDKEFCQAEEFHCTDILSESPPFVTILTLTFKEASQDSDKQGIAQISFSTCQHSQIEFPILESPLLLGNACMTSSSRCKPSPPWCSTQTTGFNSPGLYILRNEVISLSLKAYNPAVT